MTISAIATSIKSSVAEELGKVQLPEGVEISAEVQQQLADAGTRGTLNALGGLNDANIVYTSDSEDVAVKLTSFTPAELLGELFGSINN